MRRWSRFGEEEEEERESRRRRLTSSGSLRAVARMGSVVRWRRWRVRAKPMPRLEGVINIHGRDIFGIVVVVILVVISVWSVRLVVSLCLSIGREKGQRA